MLDFLSTVLYLSKKDIYNLKSSFVFPTIANASSDRLQCLLHGLLVRTPCQVPWRKRWCQASLKRRVQRRFISIEFEMVLVVMSRPQSFNPNGCRTFVESCMLNLQAKARGPISCCFLERTVFKIRERHDWKNSS